MRTRHFGSSDTGLRRSHNEDAHLADDRLGLFVVCDGVGGRRHGEVASQETVEMIWEWVHREAAAIQAAADEARVARRMVVGKPTSTGPQIWLGQETIGRLRALVRGALQGPRGRRRQREREGAAGSAVEAVDRVDVDPDEVAHELQDGDLVVGPAAVDDQARRLGDLGKRAEAPAGYTMTIAEEAAMRRLDPRAFAVLAAAAEALAEAGDATDEPPGGIVH